MLAKKLQSTLAGQSFGGPTYVEDVFSTYLYTGNGSSQVIENGIRLGDSNTGGSVAFDGSGDYLSTASNSAFRIVSSDFCVEGWFYLGAAQANMGLVSSYENNNGWIIRLDTTYIRFFAGDGGEIVVDRTYSFAVGTWYHFAFTKSGSTMRCFINGVKQGDDATVGSATDSTSTGVQIGRTHTTTNDFNGYMSNIRIVKGSAVYTTDFTPSTSALTAITNTQLLTCQGDEPFTDNSTNSFTITQNGNVAAKNFGPFTSDVAGEGGLVFIKGRDNTEIPGWYDSERSFARLFSSSTSGQTPGSNWISSANSDGFTLGTDYDVNGPGQTYASWTFRKAPKFFDVVTYTGNGTAGRTVSHNLGSVPGFYVVKKTNDVGNWVTYHRSLGATEYMYLNSTNASSAFSGFWNDTEPTDSVFSLGTNSAVNENGETYVAYLFAHDAGGFGDSGEENVISCGSYSGTGSSNFIDLGWEPQWVLIKRTNESGNNWFLFDSMRGIPMGSGDMALYPNSSTTEGTRDEIDLNATGFTLTSGLGSTNDSSSTYIYIAIRRGPMKTPETGTEVFNTGLYTGNGTNNRVLSSPITSDAVFSFCRGAGFGKYVYDRIRGNERWIDTTATSAESNSLGGSTGRGYSLTEHQKDLQLGSDDANWFNINGDPYGFYNFRRAPGFFDVVCWTGDSELTPVNHNLGVSPELVITKRRDNTGAWYVSQYVTTPSYGTLNTTNAFASQGSSYPVTSTTFVSLVNTGNFVTYLFASVPGVSKVGSFTGNGSSLTVDCGFSNGARFVLIKRTDDTSDWYVWDSARGIIAGDDPYLLLNSTAAEVTNTDYIDPYSAGFEISSSAPAAINASGGSFIYLAVA